MSAQPAPTQWDVVDVDFGPGKGHEQEGPRPALVVSNDAMNRRSGMLIVCPITKNPRAPYPGEVEVKPPKGGLEVRSLVMTWQVMSISVGRVKEIRGRLVDPVDHRMVRQALASVLDIPWEPPK